VKVWGGQAVLFFHSLSHGSRTPTFPFLSPMVPFFFVSPKYRRKCLFFLDLGTFACCSFSFFRTKKYFLCSCNFSLQTLTSLHLSPPHSTRFSLTFPAGGGGLPLKVTSLLRVNSSDQVPPPGTCRFLPPLRVSPFFSFPRFFPFCEIFTFLTGVWYKLFFCL